MDDYSNYPKSVAEARADKLHAASAWTPRDALIAALRDIDSGKINATCIIISIATVSEADNTIDMESYQSFPDVFFAVGMLEATKRQLMGY